MPIQSARYWDHSNNSPCSMELKHSCVDLNINQFYLKFKPRYFNFIPYSLSTTFHKLLVTEPRWAQQGMKDMRQDDRVKWSNKTFPIKKHRGKDSKV